MSGDRSRYGLVVSAVGAIVLAVSVFLPWYGVSFTAAGVALVQQVGDQVASQLGNASLQSYVSGLHASLGGLVGQQFVALSAHQALSHLNIILLVLAGLALLDALLPLALPSDAMPAGGGRLRRRAGRRCHRVRALPDDRPALAGGRARVAVAARGRLACAARRADHGARWPVAARRTPRERLRGAGARRLERPVRLDARQLIAGGSPAPRPGRGEWSQRVGGAPRARYPDW